MVTLMPRADSALGVGFAVITCRERLRAGQTRHTQPGHCKVLHVKCPKRERKSSPSVLKISPPSHLLTTCNLALALALWILKLFPAQFKSPHAADQSHLPASFASLQNWILRTTNFPWNPFLLGFPNTPQIHSSTHLLAAVPLLFFTSLSCPLPLKLIPSTR